MRAWRHHDPWARWGVKFAIILALSLAPWPGWGEAWADFYCEIANPVADALPLPGVRALVRPGDDPAQGEERIAWKVYVYLQRVSGAHDAAVDRVVENERMDYVSLATFLALAGASARQGWQTRALWTVGLPTLVALLGLNDLNRIVLALDRMRWIALGPVTEIALSALYTLYNGLPIVPFALPALLWWGLLRRTDVAAPWPVGPRSVVEGRARVG